MSSTAHPWKRTFEPLAFARQLSTRTAQTPMSVAEIQCGICAAAALPLSRATTLPAQAYTSEDFFAWELDNILRPGWQCVAHVSQIPKAGDFLNLDLLGEPSWCVVCERLIDTEPDIIALCAERAYHVHARVGYDQGAQVPHPAGPEFREALEAHERWWTQIWRSQAERAVSVSTMTPEFGPDGYLHCLPFSGAPVADLREINNWMAERERRRSADWRAAAKNFNPAMAN